MQMTATSLIIYHSTSCQWQSRFHTLIAWASFLFKQGVTEGYHGTIFAYGQTGSGKSFTMQGVSEPAAQKGVIPRAFEHIFESIQVLNSQIYPTHAWPDSLVN